MSCYFLIVGEWVRMLDNTLQTILHIELANYQYNFASNIFQMVYQWQAHTYIVQVIGQIGYNTHTQKNQFFNQIQKRCTKEQKITRFINRFFFSIKCN